MTRFLVLLTEADHFAKWDTADDEAQERDFACMRAFSAAVKERGSIVGGEALTDPSTARTLRPGADRPVTDGPFAEAVEQLGGFYVIDVVDLDTAVELARLLPPAYTIEVRECLDVEVG
ncbi:YciI family protein [Nocardioides sp.]|uniref:YciI family protein n=1 Tax=Nocardioides sp. TaxID=35761 RepID=UPI00271EAF38|nr:YciI family protein [Nocardioides sp.]MDO9455074.1 YciI family protein [Nocardioides sp.]